LVTDIFINFPGRRTRRASPPRPGRVIERAGNFRFQQLAKRVQPMHRHFSAFAFSATGCQRRLVAARGIAGEPRFDLLEESA